MQFQSFTPKVDSSMLSREWEIFFWICSDQRSHAIESSSVVHDRRSRQVQDSLKFSSSVKAAPSAYYSLIPSVRNTGYSSLTALEEPISLSISGFRYVAEPPYCRCLSDLKYCDFFFFFFILSSIRWSPSSHRGQHPDTNIVVSRNDGKNRSVRLATATLLLPLAIYRPRNFYACSSYSNFACVKNFPYFLCLSTRIPFPFAMPLALPQSGAT